MAEQKQEPQVHQIPVLDKKPVEVYRLLPSAHSVTARNGSWVMIPGLQRNVRVSEGSVDVVITAHGHGVVSNSAARADLGIFVNGQQMGIDGHNASGWGHGENGMALSHNPHWLPMVSVSSVTLQRSDNDYVVDVRARNAGNDQHNAVFNGTALLIQVFRSQPIMDWFSVPLDDTNTLFNINLEYRIQIRGKAFAYAATVQKEKLWFFYADDDGTQSGMKYVSYRDKRCFDDKYYISDIQCCSRRVNK